MSRRSRADQIRVTRQHHVRDLPQASKQGHNQLRAAKRLPQKVVDALYAEYQRGESAQNLARRYSKEWGCASIQFGAQMLTARFRESGYAVRGRGRPQSSGSSFGRAPSRTAKIKRTADERAAYLAQRTALVESLKDDSLLGELVREQEKDERTGHRIPSRPWLVPFDLTFRNEDDESDYGDREWVRFARRRGDFICEAAFVQPLIERIDDLRERTAA